MNQSGENILIVNHGGTSTKVAIYRGERPVENETLRHSLEQMKRFGTIWEQIDMRRSDLIVWLGRKGWHIDDFDILVSICGLIGPAAPGLYRLDEAILEEMRTEEYGRHPSNPGCALMYELGQEHGIPAITMDPSNTNEMMPVAYYSGHPLITRQCAYHVLNQRAAARQAAAALNRKYEECSIIVAHMGSGITVGAHKFGKVWDVNTGIEGDGPFTPIRTGALPVGDLIKMCYSGNYTEQDMHNQVSVCGGLAGYLGTSDGVEIEERIAAGEKKAKEAVAAMIYQTAKEIGARSITLKGEVDAIAITGGLAKWGRISDGITEWVRHLAPIFVYPGEHEIEALAAGALRYLRGEEPLKTYKKGMLV